MFALESTVGAATIDSFTEAILPGSLSRNNSSRILDPLAEAYKTVALSLETLKLAQETLDIKNYDILFEKCRQINTHIRKIFKTTNEDVNIFTKASRYRKLVKDARETYRDSVYLASEVEQASLMVQKKKEPGTIRALELAMENYEKLFRGSDHPGSGSQRSFMSICDDMAGDAEQQEPTSGVASMAQLEGDV